MIPLRLKIRNFLSYGAHTQTIDFAPYHLICLSGKNGHGKSALLDALTWTLWGQARKIQGTAKSDESLLRLGQTDMLVSLDFICNKKEYRVCREFVAQQKKTSTELSFGYLHENIFTSLTEKTLRATQQKIIDTIGLDYDAFINSVFLRQGQSNEFSQKSAKERKDILASILGINHFEALRTQAQEKIRNALTECKAIGQQHDYLKQELATLESASLNLQTITAQLAEVEEQEKKSISLVHATTLQKNNLQKKEQEAHLVLFQSTQQQEFCSKKQDLVQKIVQEWRTVRRQHKQTLNNSYQEDKRKNEAELAQYEQARMTYLQLKEQLLIEQEAFNALKNKLHNEYTHTLHTYKNSQQLAHMSVDNLTKKLDELQKNNLQLSASFETLTTTAENLLHEQQKAELIEHKRVHHEPVFERKKNFYHRFAAQGNQLQKELDQLMQKKNLQTVAHKPTQLACPLCEQQLSAEHAHSLHARFERHMHVLVHRINRLKKILPELKQTLVSDHATLEQYKKNHLDLNNIINKKTSINEELTTLATQINTTDSACSQLMADLATAQKNLLACTELYATHELLQHSYQANIPEYKVALNACDLLAEQLKITNYDAQKHETVLQRHKFYAELDRQAHTLLQEISLQDQRKKNIHVLCLEIKGHGSNITMLNNQLMLYQNIPVEMAALENTLAECAEEQKNVAQLKSIYLQQKGACEQQTALLETRTTELSLCAAELAKQQQLSDDYQEISTALGKNGIQALLIENALPEIEFEANQLLSKLTDNQSHIIIESLRDLKSGTTKETLDIKISDTVGIRPYELFSGGEAFRIDFALRIAISKLLARRSGTSLQILIIDEGFGSQDEEGLSHIMEALYKIQDEFAKIIIVSHLPTMKDQFPTHFVVSKSSTGSSINVVEQG